MYTKNKSGHQKNKPQNRIQRSNIVQKQQRINIEDKSWEVLQNVIDFTKYLYSRFLLFVNA